MDAKKPYITAIVIQVIYTGMFLLSKAALNDGMDSFVFAFYRQAAATIFLFPIALVFKRKGAPPLSFSVFSKMFLLALFGITFSLDIYGLGLRYTSSSIAAATSNTLPAITFFLALLFRMEVVKVRSISGMAKVVGILTCLAGDSIIAFYKGPCLKLFINHHPPFGDHHTLTLPAALHHQHHHPLHYSSNIAWIKGSFLLLTSSIFWGLWLVLQGPVLKAYPSKLLFTTFQCLLSSIQSFLIALAIQRDASQWKIGFDVRLLAVAYSGVMVTGVTFYLQSWCIEKKGPVFLAMFTPLSLVITTICSTFLLGELISLGSVLGGLLMVGGLYSVLWGKSKEQIVDSSTNNQNKDFTATGEVHPLPSP